MHVINFVCNLASEELLLRYKHTTMTFKASIQVMPLNGLLDPQGKAVNASLHSIGLQNIEKVRIGKQINLEVEAENEDAAKKMVEEACEKLLHNAVMEQFSYSLESAI